MATENLTEFDTLEIVSLLGNLGEFIGAIAVIATLIYLAAQLKLNKEAIEANTRQMEDNRRLSLVDNYMRRSERVEAGYRDHVVSPEVADLMYRVDKDFDSLNDFDLFLLREWAHAHMHQLDAQYYQYQHGLLEEESYINLRKAIARRVVYWKSVGIQAPRESFQVLIDEIHAEVLANE